MLSCLFSVLLLAVPEAVLSHNKTRSRSAVQSFPSLAPCCPRGSLVPYQSEEHQFCGALLTERTVCGMQTVVIGLLGFSDDNKAHCESTQLFQPLGEL